MKTKFMQKTALLALPLLALSSVHASSVHASIANPRIYPTEGSIQCNASEDLKGKDTIILFVNGIGNSLRSTQNSRRALERIYNHCKDCDVRQSYNQGDFNTIRQNKNSPNAGDPGNNLPVDDIEELRRVSQLQLEAMHKGTAMALSELKKWNDKRIDDLKKIHSITNENSQVSINGLQISIQRLRQLNNSSFKKIEKVVDRIHNPIQQGTNFTSSLRSFMTNADRQTTEEFLFFNGLSNDESNFLQSFTLATLNLFDNPINLKFNTEYRASFANNYLADRTFYDQDANNKQAITKSVEHLKHEIEEYVLSGKKVVVVAHSQGNHIAELAYSNLLKQYEIDPQQSTLFMDAIRVVGVASVSSTTPHNSYITWQADKAIFTWYKNARRSFDNANNPLMANFFADENANNEDSNDHNFERVYLANNFRGNYRIPSNIYHLDKQPAILKNPNNRLTPREVVRNLIDGAIKSANAMPAQIKTNSLLTAKLNWENWDDMDLYITEPSSNIVSYNNPTGSYGFLDRDDTDGHGPEHYYINQGLTCNDLSNKQWNFSVHQFRNGGHNAIVHFMLKIGDNQVQSRSFGLNKWPNSTVPIGKVTFENYIAGSNRLGYKMEIFDSGDD